MPNANYRPYRPPAIEIMKTDKETVQVNYDGVSSMQVGSIANELMRNGKVERIGDTIQVTCDKFTIEYNAEDFKE